MYFTACPECRKKVQQEGHQFKCEHCNKYYTSNEVKITYTVTAKIDDMSDGVFTTFMSE